MADQTKPHHTPEGFRNNYPTPPRGSFWKWQQERREKGLPRGTQNYQEIAIKLM